MEASDNGKKYAAGKEQIRAARALLGWSREKLAMESGVPMRTLSRYEEGEGNARTITGDQIQGTLEAAGVEFRKHCVCFRT
jgi:transcriptional regulator with XRE-family HTH domain